jgi:AcrR family transcriptional regulator
MRKPDLRLARAEERRRANRETILNAAEAVILRRGVGAVSMDDVAAEAQFSKATLYRYFRSKAELVFEIVVHFLDDLDARAKIVRARQSGFADRLRESLTAFLRFEVEKENITRIFLMERNFHHLMQAFLGDQGRPGSDAVRKFIQRIKAKRQALVDDTIAEIKAGIEAGEFRPADPAQVARLLSAVIQGYFVELFWLDEKPDIEAEARQLCDFILRGIAQPRPAAH